MVTGSIRKFAILPIVMMWAVGISPVARAADAPYGFAWSQGVESLPQPSLITPDGNIQRLTYQGPRLPAQITNADALVLRLCDRFGLQQVRWLSHGFTLSVAIDAFMDMYQQAVAQYGEADREDLEHGAAAWSARHIRMRIERDAEFRDNFRIVVIDEGPHYDECRAEHRKFIGQR